jgi:drug/metabolite transporter (DMT)-like permease
MIAQLGGGGLTANQKRGACQVTQNSASTAPSGAPDQIALAAGLTLAYAVIVGFTDNFVRVIAQDAGLWQFHATRSAMALLLLVGASRVLGLRLRPRNWRGVLLRSGLVAGAMIIYFGALGFLPVALVAAGLFTAPIFVLLISRFAFGQRVSGVQILAVALGFGGVVLVLGPSALAGASVAALLPIVAAVLYGLSNIATRRWCEGESAATLLAGFFAILGLCGALGMMVLALFPLDAPAGAAGFILRGPVLAPPEFWAWTLMQAAGALLGVGLSIRAYQVTHVARASVLEYLILPASAIWDWLLWGDSLGLWAVVGMGLIAIAGAMITLGGQKAPPR